jgi:hypothetical protein
MEKSSFSNAEVGSYVTYNDLVQLAPSIELVCLYLTRIFLCREDRLCICIRKENHSQVLARQFAG